MASSVISSSSRLLLPRFRPTHWPEPFNGLKTITSVSFFSSNPPKPTRVLVTGGTDGIGKHAVLNLVRNKEKEYEVTFSGRNEEKAENLIKECRLINGNRKVDKMIADLSVDAEVKKFADDVANKQFDICIINHGVMRPKSRKIARTRDVTMMTNLVSSYIITRAILEGRTSPNRPIHFVFSTSIMIKFFPGWLLFVRPEKRWYLWRYKKFNPKISECWTGACVGVYTSDFNEYTISKMGMATLASSISANKTLQNVTATSVHPGVVDTNMLESFDEGRQRRAQYIIKRRGTLVDVAGQNLIRAAEKPLEFGKYYNWDKPEDLSSDIYSNETIAAFEKAMKELRKEITGKDTQT